VKKNVLETKNRDTSMRIYEGVVYPDEKKRTDTKFDTNPYNITGDGLLSLALSINNTDAHTHTHTHTMCNVHSRTFDLDTAKMRNTRGVSCVPQKVKLYKVMATLQKLT
jgi:hypothetical protein